MSCRDGYVRNRRRQQEERPRVGGLGALGSHVELIVLACLIAIPDNCHEEHLRFSMEPVAGQACMVGAPPLLAQWSMTRPAWRVARWRCGIPGAEGYGI